MIASLRQPCDEAIIRAGTADTPCTNVSGKWVLAATILGSSMAFIDGTVTNVALPALQRDLNASVADVQWVVEAYLLFLAALLLVGGSLGDRFGRRRVFLIGVGLFAVASACCGFAGDIQQLIAARAMQGIGAALLVPGSLAIISSSFTSERRGRAIGTWSGFSAITAAIGPVLGGWLIDQFSWRAVFFINVPLAVLVIAISLWRVPESVGRTKGRLDWAAALVIAVALGALVFALIESPRLGFLHTPVVAAFLISISCFVAFLFIESRARDAMVPLELFRSRTFTGANLLTLFLYAGLGGTLFFLPLNLIQVQQYTPTRAGAALLPFILIMFLFSRWSGGLLHRYGARVPLVLGPIIAAAGFLLFVLPNIGGSYWTTFFPALLVLGIGMVVTVAPLTTVVMDSVEQTRAGIASGINNAVSRTAGLLAVAVLGIVMVQSFNRALDARLTALNLPQSTQTSVVEQRSKLAGIDLSGLEPTSRASIRGAIDASFVDGFRRVMFIGAALAFLGAIIAFALIQPKPAS